MPRAKGGGHVHIRHRGSTFLDNVGSNRYQHRYFHKFVKVGDSNVKSHPILSGDDF